MAGWRACAGGGCGSFEALRDERVYQRDRGYLSGHRTAAGSRRGYAPPYGGTRIVRLNAALTPHVLEMGHDLEHGEMMVNRLQAPCPQASHHFIGGRQAIRHRRNNLIASLDVMSSGLGDPLAMS